MSLSFGRASVLRRRTAELAGIALGERILDVGCGPGRLAILAGTLAGPAGEAFGIDPAPEMIALARRNAARAGVGVCFDVGMIEPLPYPADRFARCRPNSTRKARRRERSTRRATGSRP